MRLAFALSGAAGLVYQLAWMRRLERILGASAYASAVTLAAFMLGLGLGSYWASARAARSRRPARAYAGLELGVACWALILPLILAGLDRAYVALAAGPGQRDLLQRSLVAGLAILPPSFALGASFPYMTRAITREGGAALAYGLNTLGAALGVLFAAFALLPYAGIRAAEWMAVGLNVAAGALVWRAPALSPARAPAPKAAPPRDLPAWLGPMAFGCGFAAMLFEVAATRVFAGQLGASTHAFSVMLATFLLGMGLASLGLERVPAKHDLLRLGKRLALGSAAAAGAFVLLAPELPFYVLRSAQALSLGLGTRTGVVTLSGVLLCGAILLPFALLNGACLPLLLRRASQGQGSASSLGRLYAFNTLGAVLGALLAGFVLLPHQGALAAVAMAAAASLLGWVLLRWAWSWGALAGLLPVFAFVALWLPIPQLASMGQGAFFVWRMMEPNANPGEVLRYERESNEILYARDGVLSTVMVARNRVDHSIFLANNGKIEASSQVDVATQIQLGAGTALAWRSLAQSGGQPQAAVVGLASGMSAGAMLAHPLAGLDLIEIEPAGIEAARYFDGINHRPLDDKRTRIFVDDARHVARLSPGRWDFICSEPSNPWVAGVGSLFTLESFEIWRRSLKKGGVLGQWLQSYELEEDDFKSILRTMAKAFKHLAVLQVDDHGVGSYDFLILASDLPLRPNAKRLEEIYAEPAVAAQMVQAGLPKPSDWLSTWRMDEEGLRAYVGPGPLHEDDRVFLEYHGPWHLGDLNPLRPLLAHLWSSAADPAQWVDFNGFDPEKQRAWVRAIRKTALEQRKI